MGTHIDIGVTRAGAPACIDLEELLATRLLVQGNSGSGKSHLLRRLLEQSARLVQQIVIDPEGDFVSLAEHYGHLTLDAAECEHELPAIAARVRRHRASVVLNLEGLEVDGQLRCAAQFLNALFEADRDIWFPALVVVDEAQLFAPAAAADTSDEARRMSLVAMTNLMCRGRKRGLAGVIATQRLAKLAKNVAAEASNFLMGRTFLDIDMARAADLLGMERRQAEAFRDLERGAFIGLVPPSRGGPRTCASARSKRRIGGGAPKLLPLPMAPRRRKLQSLIFAPDEPRASRRRASAPRPPEAARAILARIEQAPPPDYVAAAPPELSDGRARGGDRRHHPPDARRRPFRPSSPPPRCIAIFCCAAASAGWAPALPTLGRFRRRCHDHARRAGLSGQRRRGRSGPRRRPRAAAAERSARRVSATEPRRGRRSGPARGRRIARFFGSHSPGRARRMLGQLEQIETIVVRTDFQQYRIIAFPELGCETASRRDAEAS